MKLSTVLKFAAVATLGYVGYKLLTGEELEVVEIVEPTVPELADVVPEDAPVITLPEDPVE